MSKYFGERQCEICEKILKVYDETMGADRGFTKLMSEEGVLFKSTWFCNECWKEIISTEETLQSVQVEVTEVNEILNKIKNRNDKQ